MAFTFLNSKLDTIAQNKVLPGLADNVGDVSPLMKVLVGDGSTMLSGNKPVAKMDFVGGPKIERVIQMDTVSARGSFSGHDILNTNPNRTRNNVEQGMKNYYTSVSVTREEAAAARGDEAKINLMENKTKEAVAALKLMMAEGIYNADDIDIIVGSDQEKGFNGVGQLAGKAGTLISTAAAGTTGGIDRLWMGVDSTLNTYWDSQLDSDAHLIANLLNQNHDSYIQKILRDVIRNCSIAGTKPTHIFTTKTIYDFLMDSLIAIQRQTNPEKGSGGFETLNWEGIPVMWDDFCPANHAYVLNLSTDIEGKQSLGLTGRRGFWFDSTPWKQGVDQAVMVKQFMVTGNMYSDNPRLQGALTSIGAS